MSTGKVTRDICDYFKNGGCTSKDNSVCSFVCGNKGIPFSEVNAPEPMKTKTAKKKQDPVVEKAKPVICDDEEPELF